MYVKKDNKLFWLLLCALVILLFGGPICQGLEQTEVTFLLHKKVVKNTKGEIINSKAISYSVYDASEFVEKKLLTEKLSVEKIQKEVLNMGSDKLREVLTSQKKIATIEASAFNQEEVAQFSYKVSDSEYPAVLFLEDELTQSTKKERTVPILITLPVDNLEKPGEFLDKIDIYPKSYSYQSTPNTPEPPKKVPNKPFLPQTGEAKTVMALIGLIFVGVTSFIWKKREKIWRMSHEKNA